MNVMGADSLFPGFAAQRIRATGTDIHCIVGGSGPPLLLLHGYPQTHAMWHRIAPALARRVHGRVSPTCAATATRASPRATRRTPPYSKRAMAQDMVEVMRAAAFRAFAWPVTIAAAASRIACASITATPSNVLPCSTFRRPGRCSHGTNQAFATAYYHWFFLIQPFDLPEKLIGADPLYYLRRKLGGWGTGLQHFDARALAEYERCFADPATIHATCEDYRAAASIDLEHDDADVTAGRKVACPLLALWGDKGVVNRMFDPLRDWGAVAVDVGGRALPSGHFLAEEAPEETLRELRAFLAA